MQQIRQIQVEQFHIFQHSTEQHADKIKGKFVLIEEDVEIGEGTEIWNFVHIRRGARIGKNCKIGDYSYIDKDTVIGDGCKIQNRCDVYYGVTLKDNVFLGPNVTFTNVKRPKADFVAPLSTYGKTILEKGSSIGANATIICGAHIGENTLVGAGLTVPGNQDIPPNITVKSKYGVIKDWPRR